MPLFASLYILTTIALSIVIEGAYVPYPYYAYQLPSEDSVPTVTSVSSNILRTPGNSGAISTYHKSIDTPFSSVRKSDVRVSNDAITPFGTPVHVAAPFHLSAATPVQAFHLPDGTPYHAFHGAPVAYAYSAAPTVAHLTFDGFGTHYAW